MQKILVALAILVAGCGTPANVATPAAAQRLHVQAADADARAAIAKALTFHKRQLLIVGERDTDGTPGAITLTPAAEGFGFKAQQHLTVVLHDTMGVHTSHASQARTGSWTAAAGVQLDP